MMFGGKGIETITPSFSDVLAYKFSFSMEVI
jgi:hypothetical protein